MLNAFPQLTNCINSINVHWFLLITIVLIIAVSFHIDLSSSFIRLREIALIMEQQPSLSLQQSETDVSSDKDDAGRSDMTKSPEKKAKDNATYTTTTVAGDGGSSTSHQEPLTDQTKEELLKEAIKKQAIQLNKYRTQLKSLAEECKHLIEQRDALEKILKETTPFDTMSDIDGLGTFLRSSKEQNELLKNEMVQLKTQEHRLTEQLQESKEIIDLHSQSKLIAAKEYKEKIGLKDLEVHQLRSQLEDTQRQLNEVQESQIVSEVNPLLYQQILERLSGLINLEGKHEMAETETASLDFLLDSLLGKFHEKESIIDRLLKDKAEADHKWQMIQQSKDERITQLEKELQRICTKMMETTIEHPISKPDETFDSSRGNQSYEIEHSESKMIRTHLHELHDEDNRGIGLDDELILSNRQLALGMEGFHEDSLPSDDFQNQSFDASCLSSQMEQANDISKLVSTKETDSSSPIIHVQTQNKEDGDTDKHGIFIRHLVKKLRELDFVIDLPKIEEVEEDEFSEKIFHLFKQRIHNYERKLEKIYTSSNDLVNLRDLLETSLSEITALHGECEHLRDLKSKNVADILPDTLETIHELEKRNEQLLSELDKARSDIDSLHSNIERLENVVTTSQEVQRTYEIQSQKQLELKNAYDSLKSQFDLLRLEKEAQSIELSKYQADVITWEERLLTYESNFHQTTADFAQQKEEMLAQVHTLEGKIADLFVTCKDKDNSLLKLTTLEAQSKEHLHSVENRLEDISNQLRSSKQALDQEQSFRRQDAEAYAARLRDLEQQLEDRHKQLADLEETSSSSLLHANHELEETRRQLATHSSELMSLRTFLRETEEALHTSQQKLDEMQASMNLLTRERDTQQQRLSEMQAHMTQNVFTEQELSRTKEEIVQLKSDAQRQLDDFRSKEIHLRSLNKVRARSHPNFQS